MMRPIELYVVPPSPPCRAVIIAARYMNINIQLIQMDLMKGEQREDWFVKMNPQHCLPTINDNGFILWESRAIMSYLANRYAPNNPIYPKNPKRRGVVDRLMQFDLNVLYRSFGDYLIPMVGENKMVSVTKPLMNNFKERKVIQALSYLDSVLASQRFVADEHLTLADFSIFCSLEFAENFHYSFETYSNIIRYYRQLKSIFNEFNIMPFNLCQSFDYSTRSPTISMEAIENQSRSSKRMVSDTNDETCLISCLSKIDKLFV
ncbi:cilia- and flagella-associated protein 20 [Sarcoptes scabiei]|nr:cilia- and flagella-associated protein 20 [Sarcoptes scabiei]